MINSRKTELLFVSLILIIFSLSIASFPLTLTNFTYGESDKNHGTDESDDKEESSDDKEESSDDKEESSDDKEESADSSDDKEESSDDKEESSDDTEGAQYVGRSDQNKDYEKDQASKNDETSEYLQSQSFENGEEKDNEDNRFDKDTPRKDTDTIDIKARSSNEEQGDSLFTSSLNTFGLQSKPSDNRIEESLQAIPPTESPDCDTEDPNCSPPILDPREVFCNDGIDNDGDGLIDNLLDEEECFPGPGPPPPTGPAFQGGGGGRDNNVKDKEDGSNEGGGGGEDRFISVAKAQTMEQKDESDVYYILIKNSDNGTVFVPSRVTLTSGFTVIWINNDESKQHKLLLRSESGDTLLNTLIHPNDFVKHQFQSEGSYIYSDYDSPESIGTITILNEVTDPSMISKPPPGIDSILSSIEIK